MKYLCFYDGCGRELFSLRTLINHMELWHGHEKSLCLPCGIADCDFVYNSMSNYRKHARHWHPEHWTPAVIGANENIGYSADDEFMDTDDDGDVDTDVQSTTTMVEEFNIHFSRQLALMQLKITDKYMLPKSTARAVFSDVRFLFDAYQFNNNLMLRSRFNDLGIPYQTDPMLSKLVELESFFEQMSNGFSTDFKFNKYLCQNLQLNLPVAVNCTSVNDGDVCTSVVHEGGMTCESEDYADIQYIPILNTLQTYLHAAV